ncbi:MAG: hypothetical protein ACRERC_02660 [Candidatus Binatia bacterium]
MLYSRRALRAAMAVVALFFVTGGAAQAQVCTGDCNGTGVVQINELIIGVNLALGSPGTPYCPTFDVNDNGVVSINELIAAVNNALNGCPGQALAILLPADGMMVLAGTVAAEIALPDGYDEGSLVIELDGTTITEAFTIAAGRATGDLVVAPGQHTLAANAEVDGAAVAVSSQFDAVALTNPDECEVLNNAECLLPYPSSRFLRYDETSATGFRLNLPAIGLPQLKGPALSPDPLNTLDGFSPTVQILMHFPQGVDAERSDAARLLPAGCCGQPNGPPWIDTRTYDARSLDADSPTVLVDAETGERVLHFIEPDARAGDDLARRALIMRPGLSLIPGHRYIVAMRNLKDHDGNAIVAEPAFAALRDRRLTTIAAIQSRRASMEILFDRLETLNIAREELVLAFDFVVQSEAQLTGAMLSMRDQAYAWLDTVEANAGEITFAVTAVDEHDCAAAGAVVWRDVKGTFDSPLYLTKDPNQPGVGFLNTDESGAVVQNGFTKAVFSVAIPCSLLRDAAPVAHPIVLGHGLFGTGESMTRGIPTSAGQVVDWTYIAGATDWRGLSQPDYVWIGTDIIGLTETHLNDFQALPDRLRQGMLNTLVLSRMMKRGLFNRDTETFQTPDGAPVFPGPEQEMFYYGISLGGIMGTWFAALTPDIERFGVDVPAINFSCLLQRSTQFSVFDTLLANLDLTDPMQKILGIHLLHESWVGGEPAGYARHITSDPLEGSGDPKKILMTPAWLDKQVSNQCTEIAARTLGLSNLTPASLQRGLQGIPDAEGPLDSAYVMWNTGSFDLFNPAHEPFIPPLANVIPSAVCDPHGARPRIPASVRQLTAFLQPGGQISNTCNGLCDAGEPDEIGGGAAEPCDPLD